MSYVPPHLRNSAGRKTTTATINSNGADHFSSKHSSHQSRIPSIYGNGELEKQVFSISARRSSINYTLPKTLAVPDPVFPKWKPSERVLRLKSEQIEEIRLRLNVDVNVAPGSRPAPSPIESFPDMCLHPSIMKDIEKHGYTAPTSIQAQAMPVALSGRDLLGCAETGSGKTAAFSIPMIQHCLAQQPLQRGDGPLALVLAPTRELAQQIEKEPWLRRASQTTKARETLSIYHGAPYIFYNPTAYMGSSLDSAAKPPIQVCRKDWSISKGDTQDHKADNHQLSQYVMVTAFSMSLDFFKTAIVVGGTNISEQRCELRAGVHIVVATPGRLIDHLQQGNTSLSRITFVVLDEADRMLDMGFEPQIRERPIWYQSGMIQLLFLLVRHD
ncbi:ATP-dependent RNA helicase p62 [Capsicum chinense]|nr:ATP-dependent RNA helicase p62 [Capsicum chinense]